MSGWRHPKGWSDLTLTAAVDEIYALRGILADEAGILEAHLSYKTFPKSRRKFAESQIERMRKAASGDYNGASRGSFVWQHALRSIGIDDGCLTDAAQMGSAAQRGLLPDEDGDVE